MSGIIKRISLLAGIIMLSVVCLAGFYNAVLPNQYFISEGETLMISSLFSISAKPCESKVTVALTDISARSSRTTENTLMLFGSVPIKNVTSTSVHRPTLVPCGQAFGIKLITDGVMVVDFSKIDGVCPAKDCGIKEGDVIISINGKKVQSNSDVARLIKASKGENCRITAVREGGERKFTLTPVLSDGIYKAGMWVRDSSAGIGTLTFYEEETGFFGGLGHPVCDSDTKEMLPLSEGAVGDISITGFVGSENGKPGQLLGEFSSARTLGDITLNCEDGVFGRLDKNPSDKEAVELGFRQEIKKGKAEIYCSLDNGETKSFQISIEQINLYDGAEHDMVIKVTDKDLLEETGGIIQGMSGSPIIQNGRIVGAVTHVFIDDPTMGYAIFADEMYSRTEECAASESSQAVS
ncbi:MAG: SpoIVB peptidase [Ruminococcus sp.]|nr:SpoIVB peptidase [Ruminococcus sp.]